VIPEIASRSSVDDPYSCFGATSIFTSTGLLTTAGAADWAIVSVAAVISGVYSPVSSARVRSADVYKPIALRDSNGK
jgi:hypothetical protein